MSAQLATAQFIAYVALTAASLTVAVVSLTFAYRQYFGWKPLVLVTSHGLRNDPRHPSIYFATLSVEFWNRRRYPVILRGVDAKFSTIKIEELPHNETADSEWHVVAGSTMHTRCDEVLEPAGHKKLEIAAPFVKRLLDDLEDNITITAMHYDPRKNKHEVIIQSVVWHLR